MLDGSSLEVTETLANHIYEFRTTAVGDANSAGFEGESGHHSISHR